MSRRPIFWSLFAVAAVAATVFLLPAAADWLVTKDGSRIETDGPWKVEGRLVVFKRPDGTYASLRRTEIDLEASERLTLEMVEAATERPEAQKAGRPTERERRESVVRLTEKELPPRGRPRPDDAGGGQAAASSPGSSESPLRVLRWSEAGDVSEGVAFTGQVRNSSQHMALGVAVTVTLTDDQGERIASTAAELTTDALPPGAITGFRVGFPGVFAYARADFDVSGDLVLSGSPEEGEEEETGRR